MTKERIPISGDLKSKVKQLMEYAGWYEGRSVDISIAEQYYANHGVPMMKPPSGFTASISACAVSGTWHRKIRTGRPTLNSRCFHISSTGLRTTWRTPVSGICPAVIWQRSSRLLVSGVSPSDRSATTTRQRFGSRSMGNCNAKYDYQDEIECFPDVFVLIERDLRACKFDSAAMKTVEALDGKL